MLEEIRNASISNPITDAEARKLPYLQAVIKEGLRIYPPATGLMSKEVPAGGDTICGFYVPEGTGIGWSTFGMMRNVKIWGNDADIFRPERWLEGTSEEIRKKEIYIELVFGYGKYQCLGKNIASLELNKVFVQVRGFQLLSGIYVTFGFSSCATSNSQLQTQRSHGSRLMQVSGFTVTCG